MKYKIIPIVLVFLLSMFEVSLAGATKEVRALWATRYSLISKKSIDKLIDTANKYNFNLIFAQVRGRGEAFYNSKIEPKYGKLKDNFDPLKYLIKRAHDKDIEIHAWLNTYYVWSHVNKPKAKSHVLNKKPNWFLVDKKERSIIDYSRKELTKKRIEGAFLDPAKDEVKRYLEDVYLEVVRKYKIDGLHFDYVRYPKSYFGYSKEAIKKFKRQENVDILHLVNNIEAYNNKYGKNKVKEILKKWYQFKKDQVSELVKKVSDKTKKINKKIKVTAAVVSNIPKADFDYSQEWGKWLCKGWIDFAVPMIYQKRTKQVEDNLKVIEKKVGKKPIVVGIGAYLLDARGIIDKIKFARSVSKKNNKILGVSLFSYDGFKGKEEQLRKIKKTVFNEKVILPWRNK